VRCGLHDFDAVRFERGLTFLLNEQERDGAWFGRWGVHYVYGTSGALAALGPMHSGWTTSIPAHAIDEAVVRGAVWLKSVQQHDGGWGETTDSYQDPALRGTGPTTASQTAWALIGLLACTDRLPLIADAFTPAIERGVDYLLRTQHADGTWDEPQFTGTGFPQHFYLNYHQYRLHFPLSALGRYAASRERTPSGS
jgi:squalene-hopene/tetraprenyl-beta-curcumene cyclase